MRKLTYTAIALLAIAPLAAAFTGTLIGDGILHPMNLNPNRLDQARQMLARTGATKEDLVVRAPDGVELEITVEISASKKDGYPDDKARIVTENARTLKFDQYGFEDH